MVGEQNGEVPGMAVGVLTLIRQERLFGPVGLRSKGNKKIMTCLRAFGSLAG